MGRYKARSRGLEQGRFQLGARHPFARRNLIAGYGFIASVKVGGVNMVNGRFHSDGAQVKQVMTGDARLFL